MFAVSVYSIVRAARRLEDTGNPFFIAAIVILSILALGSLGFAVFVWILFSTHVILIVTNQTTSEYLKNSKGDHPGNPFRKFSNQLGDEEYQKVLHVAQEEKPPRLLDSPPKPRDLGGKAAGASEFEGNSRRNPHLITFLSLNSVACLLNLNGLPDCTAPIK
jgi:hypothetical protein